MVTQTQTKTIGTRQGWQYECTKDNGMPEDCGYLLRNHDVSELARFSQTHAKDSHKVDVPVDFFRTAAKKVMF